MEHEDFQLGISDHPLQLDEDIADNTNLNLRSEPNRDFNFNKYYSPLKLDLISRAGIKLSDYSMVYHQEVWLMPDEIFESIGCEKVFSIELLKLHYIRRFETEKFKSLVRAKGLDFILNLEPNKLAELLSLPLELIDCEDYTVANMVLTFEQDVLDLLGLESLCKHNLQKLRILRAFNVDTIMEIGVENILSMSTLRLLALLKIHKGVLEAFGYQFLLLQEEAYLCALIQVSPEWVNRVGVTRLKGVSAGEIRRILVSGV